MNEYAGRVGEDGGNATRGFRGAEFPNSGPLGSVFCRMKPRSLFRALPLLLSTAVIFAGDAKSVLEVPLKDIDGKDTSLKPFAGKVLLLVNVASECGSTPQYSGLQALWEKYRGRGLVVCGFPCNDFGGQEPGSNAEIKTFCTKNYGVTFPMFDKVKAAGAGKHPLYAALTGKDGAFPGDVTWNFGKFLVGRDGKPLQRFEPDVEPDDAALVKAIEDALAEK